MKTRIKRPRIEQIIMYNNGRRIRRTMPYLMILYGYPTLLLYNIIIVHVKIIMCMMNATRRYPADL